MITQLTNDTHALVLEINCADWLNYKQHDNLLDMIRAGKTDLARDLLDIWRRAGMDAELSVDAARDTGDPNRITKRPAAETEAG